MMQCNLRQNHERHCLFCLISENIMFSVLSRAVDLLLGAVFYSNNEGQHEGDNSTNSASEDTLDLLFRDQDQQDVLLTAIVDKDEQNADALTVAFTGVVSQVFCGHGLIDGEVYFAADSVSTGSAGKPVQVGDKVNVVARQQFKDGGWIAESVTVVESTWEEEERELAPLVPTGEVGKVTQFRNGEGIINKNIRFDNSACKEGYRPHVGDWVTVELDTSTDNNDGTDQNQGDVDDDDDGFGVVRVDTFMYATAVAPLREWCFEGVVSAAMPDHGYIDEEVYFRPDACLNGYRPRKWDSVKVGAIESTQGKCNWRAVYVVPTSADSSAFSNR